MTKVSSKERKHFELKYNVDLIVFFDNRPNTFDSVKEYLDRIHKESFDYFSRTYPTFDRDIPLTLNVEYHYGQDDYYIIGQRLETDAEYKKRMDKNELTRKRNKANAQAKKEREIKILKGLLKKHGVPDQ